jgi:intracellular septation protein
VKQLIDFIPLILFFVVFKTDPRAVEFAGQTYQFGGIFSATAVLIASSLVVYGILFVTQRRLEKGQWATLLGCLIFGGLTLAFHSETFLKWKAPVVNWVFALAFIGSHFIGGKLLIKRLMGHALSLPDPVWTRLNIAWIIFFIFCRGLHLPGLLGRLQGVRQPRPDPAVPDRPGHLPVPAPAGRYALHPQDQGLICSSPLCPPMSRTPWRSA